MPCDVRLVVTDVLDDFTLVPGFPVDRIRFVVVLIEDDFRRVVVRCGRRVIFVVGADV